MFKPARVWTSLMASMMIPGPASKLASHVRGGYQEQLGTGMSREKIDIEIMLEYMIDVSFLRICVNENVSLNVT